MVASQYSEADYARIAKLTEEYRAAVQTTDAEWVALLSLARPWITEQLGVVLVRVYLRIRHGRREDADKHVPFAGGRN